jgi:sugar phosphate isomerase/epimerase
MPKPISVQLYSLRELAAKDFVAVLKAVSNIGYPYVEFAGLHGKTAREIRKVLDEEGLKASSTHGPIFDPTKYSQVADEASTIGYKHLVSGFGRADFETDDAVKVMADKVNAAVSFYSPKGFTVNLHNHEWEFQKPERFHKLMELCPKAGPQLDIYWVKVGGCDPVEMIRRYAGRVRVIHVKDGPADAANRALPMTAVGQGRMDIPGCIRAAEMSGCEFLTVELDNCATDMLQAVRDSYNFLTQRSLGEGKR